MDGWQFSAYDAKGDLLFRSDTLDGPVSRGTLLARYAEIVSEERPEIVRMEFVKEDDS